MFSLFLAASLAQPAPPTIPPPRIAPPIAPPIMTIPTPVPPRPVLTAPPAPPSATTLARGPRPIGNHLRWIGDYDYPSSEFAANHQGVLQVRLAVNALGRATGCDVVASTGWPVLDATSCRILIRRGRFTPATDAKGAPTTGTYLQRVIWQVEEPTRYADFQYAVGGLAKGSVPLACAPVPDGRRCDHSLVAAMVTSLVGGRMTPDRWHGFDEHVVARETASVDLPPVPAGARVLSDGTAHFEIRPNGSIGRCTVDEGGVGDPARLCLLIRESFVYTLDLNYQPVERHATARFRLVRYEP